MSLILVVGFQLATATTAASSEAASSFQPELDVPMHSTYCDYWLHFDASEAFVPPDGFIYEYRRTDEQDAAWISNHTTFSAARLPGDLEAGLYEARVAATWDSSTSAWSDVKPFRIYRSDHAPHHSPLLYEWEEIAGDIEVEFWQFVPGSYCPGHEIVGYIVGNRRLLSTGWEAWEYTYVTPGSDKAITRFEADAEVHQVKALAANTWGGSRWSETYTIELP